MKQFLFAVAAAALIVPVMPAPVQAGPIENACLQSGRQQATRALCRCVDSVAQRTLTRAEQRRAASFFRDPQLAQDVRMSKSDRDNAFWARYRSFGETAEVFCAG